MTVSNLEVAIGSPIPRQYRDNAGVFAKAKLGRQFLQGVERSNRVCRAQNAVLQAPTWSYLRTMQRPAKSNKVEELEMPRFHPFYFHFVMPRLDPATGFSFNCRDK
jgi:hypothetical protein